MKRYVICGAVIGSGEHVPDKMTADVLGDSDDRAEAEGMARAYVASEANHAAEVWVKVWDTDRPEPLEVFRQESIDWGGYIYPTQEQDQAE